MNERQIRQLIRQVLDELARVRRVVVPGVVGAGIALSACGDSRPVQTDGGDAKKNKGLEAGRGPKLDSANPTVDGGALPPYMAPDPDLGPDVAVEVDVGVVPPYMAPDGGPVPLYMATDTPEFKGSS